MKQAWNRLGSPDSISWQLLLLAGIQQFFGSLAAPFIDIDGRLPEFMGVRVLAIGAIFAVLGFGRLVLVRVSRRRRRPWVTLAIFALAILAGTTTMNGLLIATGFTNEWTLARRLVVAIPGIFAILIVVALLVTYARDAEAQNRRLAQTIIELERLREESASRGEVRRRELLEGVRNTVSRELESVHSADRVTIGRELTAVVDDVVRPLSYALSNASGAQGAPVLDSVPTSMSWSSVVRRAMFANPSHPIASTLWTCALLSAFLVSGFGLRGLAGVGALGAISFASLFVTRILWNKLPLSLSVRFRVGLFCLVVFVTAVATAVAMTAVTGYDFLSAERFIGWTMLNFSMTWTVTLVYAANEYLRTSTGQLTSAAENLRREVIQRNNEYRVLQKTVSRVLHGPIQTAISAAIQRLKTAKDPAAEESIMAEMRRRISDALATDQAIAETDVDARLGDIVELWDEVCTITISISDEAREHIRHDVPISTAVVELAREGCNNAMRHGDARRVDVSIAMGKLPSTIDVVLTNDGAPLSPDTHTGLGSRILDETCLSWSLRQDGPMVRLEAQLPLTIS